MTPIKPLIEAVIDTLFETTPEEVDAFRENIVSEAVRLVEADLESKLMTEHLKLTRVAQTTVDLCFGIQPVIVEGSNHGDSSSRKD